MLGAVPLERHGPAGRRMGLFSATAVRHARATVKVLDWNGEFNFLLIPTTLGTLLLGSSVVQAFSHPERLSNGGLLVGLALATVLVLPGALLLREQHREERFRAWLIEHHADLYQGGASYHGITLTAASQLQRYAYVQSLVLVSVQAIGRPLVLGLDDPPRCRRIYDLVTLLWGWWFITGPFLTVATVYRNHKAPQTLSVAEYMHQMGRQGPTLGAA